MSFLKFTSKDKEGRREVRFSYVDGIPGLCEIPNEVVDVTIDPAAGKLNFQSAISKKRSAELDLSRVKDVRDVNETQIFEANKSVLGRSVVGGLLLGPLGSIVGGMSGLNGRKSKKVQKHFVMITYETTAQEEKQIVLEIVGASIGWQKFVNELPKDSNSPFAPVPTENHIEL